MPITDFEKQKEMLINDIRAQITEDKELDGLLNQFNKIMVRKEAKAKKAMKLKFPAHASNSKTRIPCITALQSTNNITHEEALQELHKTIETWK